VFNNVDELSKDTKWSKYITLVYGALPTFGYPICLSGFRVLYPKSMEQAGLTMTPKASPTQLGDYYQGTEFRHKMNMIYHGEGPFKGFKSNQWVEALHCASELETASAWYYYGPGSGVWINSGNTKQYQRRQESWKEILGRDDCGHDSQCGGVLFTTAKENFGWDTVQYLAEGKDKFMFVHTTGQGHHTCGAEKTVWKAGWSGITDCDCDETRQCQNCRGYSSADVCDDCEIDPTLAPTIAPTIAPSHHHRRRHHHHDGESVKVSVNVAVVV